MWYNNKFFRYTIGFLLILLTVFMLGQINFILDPINKVAATVLIPLLISGLLYYILRPLVDLLEKVRIPRIVAILISFVVLIAVLAVISAGAGTMAASQVSDLLKNLPGYLDQSVNKITELISTDTLPFIKADQLQKQFSDLMGKVVPFITQGLFSGISTAANITTVLLIVPFILFYLLKDDKLFSKQLLSIIPGKHKERSVEILSDVDNTLSAYIIGQAFIALTSGILMYIGYIIFGLRYSLILALFVMLTSFIPIIGAFIGIVPAVLVGLTSSDPYIIIKLIILMFVVQQLEGNLISPQIIGKRMNIHPLTFIILLIGAASLYGFVGMIVAVPVYAVLKVLIKNIYELYKLRKA